MVVEEETCECIPAMAEETCIRAVEEKTCKCVPARVAVANCKYILGEEEETRKEEAAYA